MDTYKVKLGTVLGDFENGVREKNVGDLLQLDPGQGNSLVERGILEIPSPEEVEAFKEYLKSLEPPAAPANAGSSSTDPPAPPGEDEGEQSTTGETSKTARKK